LNATFLGLGETTIWWENHWFDYYHYEEKVSLGWSQGNFTNN